MKIVTMYLIFFLIVLNKFVVADDDESKYIDLLPEKEKEDFLQRIARRILADVKTRDDRDKYDGEVSEDELDTHHEFVQKILKEESDNLRRNDEKGKGNDVKDKDATVEKNENTEDDLKVKSLETNKESLNRDDDRYFDLTLRHGTRNTGDTKGDEVQVDKIPEKQHTINVNSTKQVGIVNQDIEEFKVLKVEESTTIRSIEPRNVGESDSEDIQIKPSRRNCVNNIKTSQTVTPDPSELNIIQLHGSDTVLPENSIKENNLTQIESQLNDISSTNSVSTESITVTDDIKETTPQEINSELKTDLSLDENHNSPDNSLEIITTENNPRKYLENNMTGESNSTELTTDVFTSVNNIAVEEVTNKSIIAELKQENTKDEIPTKDESDILNLNILRDIQSPIDDSPHSNVIENLNESVEITHTATESTIYKILNIETKTLPANITTSSNANINENNNSDSNIHVATTVKYNTDQKDTSTYSGQVLHLNNQDSQKAKENISSKKKSDELQKEYRKKNILREYNVFEVPRGESPFVKKEALINQEQPYYVPVYNYEPNNAYFNAKNRLGPNYNSDNAPYMDRLNKKPVGENEKDVEKFEYDYFFDTKEKGHRKFRFRVSTKRPPTEHPLIYSRPFVISKPKYTDIYFNFDDYLDMDYSFGRMEKVSKKRAFPSSSDEEHPYNSIAGKDLNDHVRAIRNILLQHKIFGFIPQLKNITEEKNESKETETETPMEFQSRYFRSNIIKDSKLDANKNIATDYYFGRMQNTDVENVGYIKQNKKSKNLKKEEIYNIRKDLQVLKYNDGVGSVTPHTYVLNDPSQENESDFLKKTAYSAEYAKLEITDKEMPITRKNNDEIDVYVKVLNDMVQKDDIGLKRYDWLGTTVDVRAALSKLTDVIEAWEDRAVLDPADIELLNYTLFLHKSAKELILEKEREEISKALRKQILLPRNKKKKKKKNLLKEKGLLQRAWLLRMTKQFEINDFKELLNDFRYYLYDLHEAIKNIAIVTKFKNQNWYESLKKIYFTSDKRNMLEVILHLTTTRLLGLIENSAQNGLEDDYIDYILQHEKEVDRTLEEFMFVSKLLDELKRYEY